jgi:hypothetical protein
LGERDAVHTLRVVGSVQATVPCARLTRIRTLSATALRELRTGLCTFTLGAAVARAFDCR